MISDVLSTGVDKIRNYQRDMPDIYNDDRDMINAVASVMDALRHYYDAPPIADIQELRSDFWKKFATANDALNSRQSV